jgi:hypothetical protein
LSGAASVEPSNSTADPRITMLSVKDADPFGFYEELRTRGSIVRDATRTTVCAAFTCAFSRQKRWLRTVSCMSGPSSSFWFAASSTRVRPTWPRTCANRGVECER